MRSSGFRQLADAVICLALAVILFRTFALEGYMISTGSMAPTLLGYHKRIVCPTCAHRYAFGTHFDESLKANSQATANSDRAPWADAATSCPNCGQSAIDTSRVQTNQGDQLLVNKNAYLLRDPRRWEVIVFRSPTSPLQAFVKRLAGLPGESVEIRAGDLYIDGTLARKPLDVQRAMRILVYDNDQAPPAAIDWQPRWTPVATRGNAPAWTVDDKGFAFDGGDQADGDFAWLAYRHWLRTGGNQRSRVRVPRGSAATVAAALEPSAISFNDETSELIATGTITAEQRDRLLSISDDPEFTTAVTSLYEKSHIAPVSDSYGYNEPDPRHDVAVPDLMLATRVKIGEGDGEVVVRMNDGQESFDCVLDAGAREIRLHQSNQPKPLRAARLHGDLAAEAIELEMSLIDRQVLVAVNGETAFAPWTLMPRDEEAPASRQPVRVGARGLAVQVDRLQLYRDVYYTNKGSAKPFQLEDDEYYVLGDNSPLSYDSRSWPDGAVQEHLLVGKPFVVHLPSRPGQLQIGSRTVSVRIPDFSRIRYIR